MFVLLWKSTPTVPHNITFLLALQSRTFRHSHYYVISVANTCLVTPGALGIAVQAQPTCPSGTATFKVFRDTSCANHVTTDLQYDNCYFDGPDGVSAIAFVCDRAVVTATSTAPAGSSTIPVAADTPRTSSSGAQTGQSAPPSNGASTTSDSHSLVRSIKSSQTQTMTTPIPTAATKVQE